MNKPMEYREQLYKLLPQIYRDRDKESTNISDSNGRGDQEKLLKALGVFLDSIQGTLLQRYADNFPDAEEYQGRKVQPWVLPYHADLLDVKLQSKSPDAQRLELKNAIRWRQGKGSIAVVREIAQSILGRDIVVQEGRKRVATTPVTGFPMFPEAYFGESKTNAAELEQNPISKARQWSVPAVTPSVKQIGGAKRESSFSNPAVFAVDADQIKYRRYVNPHGVPCKVGSHHDQSFRTPVISSYRNKIPKIHPSSILIYTSAAQGFFTAPPTQTTWERVKRSDNELFSQDGVGILEVETHTEDRFGENYVIRTYKGITDYPVKITGKLRIGGGYVDEVRLENIWIASDLIVKNTRVVLTKSAVRNLYLQGGDRNLTLVNARSSILEKIEASLPGKNVVRLDNCTVLRKVGALHLEATDSIFTGSIETLEPSATSGMSSQKNYTCLRYCRVIPNNIKSRTRFDEEFVRGFQVEVVSDEVRFNSFVFGKPGCGVLRSGTSRSVLYGAEDGGEIGAFNDSSLTLKADSLVKKLDDFLPVGIEAQVIEDSTL